MNLLKTLTIITLVSTLVSCSKLKEGSSQANQKPNIIFIMTDDHTKQAMSLYDDRLIETPNLDRIGKEGVTFTKSYVTNSICAPSRAVMLTGKYSHMNGKMDNHDGFNWSQQMFPKLLQSSGYQTALIGKIHLNGKPQGFDYWKVLPGQGDYYNPAFLTPKGKVIDSGYVTNIITDNVIDYISNRDESKPFCVLYHHKAPHRKWFPPLKYLRLFDKKEFPLPETYYDDYKTRTSAFESDMRVEDLFYHSDLKLKPKYYGDREEGSGGYKGGQKHDYKKEWKNMLGKLSSAERVEWDRYYDSIGADFDKRKLSGKELSEWKYQRYMRDYLACVKAVDDNIGRLLDYLDKQGLSENTLIVYTSDQGFYLGEHGWFDKRFMYEESHSMPLAMKYPAKIKAGTVCDEHVLNLDFAPTLLDFAGVEIPEDIQGSSMKDLVTKGDENWRESVYYHYYEYPSVHHVKRHYGVKNDKYKLIHFYNNIDSWELFDLEKDPKELTNVYGDSDYSEIQATMHKELEKLKAEFKDDSDGI